MFTQYVWQLNGEIREIEYHWMGNYGAKGEKRGKRKKATPEQVKKQNLRNKINRVRRLMIANFKENDLFCTLKYPEGARPGTEKVKKDLSDYLRCMRREYKKLGVPLKFIYRIEIGELGGTHIHILFNRVLGKDTDTLIQDKWKHGRVNFQNTYMSGEFENLAAYIVKEPEEGTKEYRQLSLLPETEKKTFVTYNASRNLIRPKPEKKTFSHWTMRKILANGLDNIPPSKGYYVIPTSVVHGINPFTGMSYLYYRESVISPRGGHREVPKELEYD